jgi:hypothetical protein
MIFSLTTTLEKPTRGKLVREGVLLFPRSEEMSFIVVNNIKNLIQNYLENHAKICLQKC